MVILVYNYNAFFIGPRLDSPSFDQRFRGVFQDATNVGTEVANVASGDDFTRATQVCSTGKLSTPFATAFTTGTAATDRFGAVEKARFTFPLQNAITNQRCQPGIFPFCTFGKKVHTIKEWPHIW